MNNVFESKEYCCGCTACVSICPKNAIIMKYDECGFSYPVINQDKCIDCGLCKKTCSFHGNNKYKQFKQSYVVKHKSNAVVNDSRSGGVFTAISDIILNAGGVVYGALLDDKFFVRHVRATNSSERDALRKSKYVQSNLEGIFSQIANDLGNGLQVLFTGTGCQCDGLRGFLINSRVPVDNLYVCDIVCHSNASPILFQRYLEYQSQRFNSKIKEYYFRDKDKYPWMSHVEKIVFENGKVFYTDEYTNLFFTDDIRPSCYNCKYTSLCRSGDFTIADCWGGENIYPEIVNYKGASLVLVNNEKASKLLAEISKSAIVKEIDIEHVLQPRLQGPETMSKTYDKFWDDYKTLDFSQFMKIYGENHYSFWNIWIGRIKRILKLPFRIVKRIMREIKND